MRDLICMKRRIFYGIFSVVVIAFLGLSFVWYRNYRLTDLVVIGDSMVRGHSLDVDSTWGAFVAHEMGLNYVCLGVNGCALSYNDVNNGKNSCENSVFANRYLIPKRAKYILVYAGTNDMRNRIAVGECDNDSTTVSGAVNVLCQWLKKNYPQSKIGFITPYDFQKKNVTKEEARKYNDAIIGVCKQHGVAVFDNPKQSFLDWYCSDHRLLFTLGDSTHLNVAGMKKAAPQYKAFIESL